MLTGKAQAEGQVTHPESQKEPKKPKVDPREGPFLGMAITHRTPTHMIFSHRVPC